MRRQSAVCVVPVVLSKLKWTSTERLQSRVTANFPWDGLSPAKTSAGSTNGDTFWTFTAHPYLWLFHVLFRHLGLRLVADFWATNHMRNLIPTVSTRLDRDTCNLTRTMPNFPLPSIYKPTTRESAGRTWRRQKLLGLLRCSLFCRWCHQFFPQV